jgi:ketosteroid isomerase-like protein
LRREESVKKDQGLAALQAEAQITRVIYRRARATDRADVDLALSCYHEGATERFENYSGDSRAFVSQRLSKPNPAMAYMFHFISNVLVTLEGEDSAFVESYFDLRYQVRGASAVDHSVGGRYLDTFRRIEGRWAIFHRDTVVDFRRAADEAPPYWSTEANGFLFGRRGADDPLYQHIERGPSALI